MLKKHKKGFSLIELIVAIAILATMLLVLTPAAIKYVDESRTAKDLKTTADFTEVIESSLSDDTVYQEITKYIIGKYKGDKMNYSSYIDHPAADVEEYKESLGEDSYTYSEKARRVDGIRYFVGGEMRGITITFPVTEDKKIDYINGRINEIQPGGIKGIANSITLKDASPTMVEYIKNKFGKNIPIDSATYRFSELTVFIYTGPAVSFTETADSPMKVYSQWDGTNLIDVERVEGVPDAGDVGNQGNSGGTGEPGGSGGNPSGGTPGGTNTPNKPVIPVGGIYEPANPLNGNCCDICGYNFEDPGCWCGSYVESDGVEQCTDCNFRFGIDVMSSCWCGNVSTDDYDDLKDLQDSYDEGDEFPDPQYGDKYIYGDYTYIYEAQWNYEPYSDYGTYVFYNNSSGCWTVTLLDESGSGSGSFPYFKQQDTYQPWLTEIAGKPVNAQHLFYGATERISTITIPVGANVYSFAYNNYYYTDGLEVTNLNFNGTKAQWSDVLFKSGQYWFSDLNVDTCGGVVHCTDGDVCISHTGTLNIFYYDANVHVRQSTCTTCNLYYAYSENHYGGSANCTNLAVCSICEHEYGNLNANVHNYVANSGATKEQHSSSQHKQAAKCSLCNASGYLYQSHNMSPKPGATYSYYSVSSCQVAAVCSDCGYEGTKLYSHTGGTATCTHGKLCSRCGYEYKESNSHTPTLTSCSAASRTCSTCGKTLVAPKTHNYVGNRCTTCGDVRSDNVLTFSFSRDDLYKTKKERIIVGTWDFSSSGVTHVNITVTVGMEEHFDWLAITPGSYTAGNTASRTYLKTNGTLATGTIPTSNSTSDFKFTGNRTYTLNNIAIPKGTLIFYSDQLVFGDGATVTITPV